MSISKHVLVMACVVMPCFVASAMPSPRPVARLAPEVVKEIKGALNSNMPNLVLKLLQDNSLGVNSQLMDKRETALHLAAELGVQQAAEVLLGQGAKVNVRDDEGRSPLAYAQTNGHTQLAELLQIHAEAELSLLQKEKTSDAQDLFAAAKNNDRASAELLLAKGADPRARKVHGHTTYDQLGFKTPFHVAFDAGHYSLAAILLKEAMGINGLDERGWTPLMIAITADDWDLVRELLNDGANIMAGHKENALDVAEMMESEKKLLEVVVAVKGTNIDIKGIPLLMWAIIKGHIDIVKYLVEQGADLNAQDEDGWTVLMWAAQRGHIDIVRYLVEQGAEVNLQYKDGYTALMQAVREGHTSIVRYLVEHGADLSVQDRMGGTALMQAAQRGHIDIVRYLVEQGAKVNVQDRNGGTALMQAAREGHIDIVRYLVEQEANINMQNEYGYTALIRTVQNRHIDIVRYLVEQGADVNASKGDGFTALPWAVLSGHIDIVRYLVEQGADIYARDKDGRTVLMLAAQRGKVDTARYLVEQGAKVNVQDKNGNTALIWAVQRGRVDMARYLVEQGTDLNVQNHRGFTALIWAAPHGHIDIIRCLVEHGANLNAQDKDGNTALIWAAYEGHRRKVRDIVRYLVEQGADINVLDNHGGRVLDVAKRYKLQEIVDILQAAGGQESKPAA